MGRLDAFVTYDFRRAQERLSLFAKVGWWDAGDLVDNQRRTDTIEVALKSNWFLTSQLKSCRSYGAVARGHCVRYIQP